MKDYNFMISDDRIHKTRFCKKRGGLTKTFLIKRGVGAKGGLERFHILRRGLAKKRGGVTFLGGGSYPGAHYVYITPILLLSDLSNLCVVDHLWPLTLRWLHA